MRATVENKRRKDDRYTLRLNSVIRKKIEKKFGTVQGFYDNCVENHYGIPQPKVIKRSEC